MHNKYKLYVISQTHWDREWYQTFQGFRKRLVFMMDQLIENMEKDPDYKYFHMDGQTITLEDYLEIRPENRDRLRKLISDGRIIIGPWYVMPDEFLVSGESLVRNLQKGFEISRDYGVEPMKNGYVVDIFGHNSQFPQILKGFGIDSAVLFRGVGDYQKDAFTWEGADGSNVLVLKLDRDRSYSNFYFAVRWPFDGREYEKEELVARMRELLKLSGELAVSDNLLMMDGVDHIEIETELPKIIKLLNENIDEIEITHSTLEEFVKAQMNSGACLDTIKGELYDVGFKGVNNQVLKNVLSSMVHIKQMNDECERLLTCWAEPFDAVLGQIGNQNMGGFLKEAWKLLLQNHPHDSICGCSISRVHMDNEYRFNQVNDIGNEVVKHDMEVLVSKINTSASGKPYSIVLFNAGQTDYNGIVEADIELPSGSQNNFKIFDNDGNEVPYQLLAVKKGNIKGIFKFGRLPEFQPRDVYRVAFNASIPSVGYSTYGFEEYKNVYPQRGDYTYREFHQPTRYNGTMRTGHRTWENEFLKVNINDNGTLNVTNRITGKDYVDLLIFEDCADVGDGWNYRKPLIDSRYLSLGAKAEISVESDGPLVTCWKITQTMQLPVGMNATGTERSADTAEFKVTTLVQMKKGCSRLEFKTTVDNNISEHRLRVIFPNSLNSDSFYSSTPYYLQKRSIKKPDTSNYNETDTGVFPNQGVIILQDQRDCFALYNKGLYEVEIMEENSKAVALTLFRSFRNEVGRDQGELSFMKRSMTFEYALELNPAVKCTGDIMISGEAWRTGIKSVCADSHSGDLAASASFLNINIPGAVLSAFRTGKDGMAVIRLYNCTDQDTEGTVTIFGNPKKAYILDLNENIIKENEITANKLQVKLDAAKILTLGIKL